MSRLSFRDHPASVNETYVEHLRFASGFGLAMLAGGAACLLHGLFPFLFTSTGSATVRRLHARLSVARPASAPAGAPEAA